MIDAPDTSGTLGYLDHAASTPMRPGAVEAMLPFLGGSFANPSGGHLLARRARRAVDDAREELAEHLGARPGEVVFTSGGTEADNLAVLGVHDRLGGVLLCSAVEHHAVLDPVLSRGGILVPVGADGLLDLVALSELLEGEHRRGAVSMVAVMLVNNEVGTVQPIAEIVDVVRAAGDAAVHVDAVQAFAWLDVAAPTAGADLVAVSGHKIGGPKGVGALVVRGKTPMAPRQLGGGQERDRRSGTQNVAGIVGMAAAARLAAADRDALTKRVVLLRDRLAAGLASAVSDLTETASDPAHTIPGIVHVCIEGVDSEALLFLLEERGVYASAGSSCSSGAMEPSHVLLAMGVPSGRAGGALRLSMGWTSTVDDVDLVLGVLPDAVEQLRAHVLGASPA